MRRCLALLLLLSLLACPAAAGALHLRSGDLLFVTAGSDGLSSAIDRATAHRDGPSFDHVALLAGTSAHRTVLHADERGSREQPLAEFIADARAKGRQIDVYRLRRRYRGAIPDALARARQMLGKPYNFSYVLNKHSYYCSDFIQRAFRARHLFALQPMNFKDPRTGRISPYWTDRYARMGMAVPQGQPGTNPNDMARSPVLQALGPLR